MQEVNQKDSKHIWRPWMQDPEIIRKYYQSIQMHTSNQTGRRIHLIKIDDKSTHAHIA